MNDGMVTRQQETKQDFNSKAAAWAFPISVGIVGFLVVDKLNSIDSRLQKLESGAATLIEAVADIENLDRRVNAIESTYFLKQEEIVAPKRRQ